MSYQSYVWGGRLKWIIIGVIVFILLISSVSTYNGLVDAEQNVETQWSQVENVMQTKLDLIPNLVETVKGYTKHEETVFGDIANARSALLSSGSIDSKIEADKNLTEATQKILLLAESYPDLKASQQFHDLQIQLAESENKISRERQRFIEKVQFYNKKVKRFPGSIFAKVMGFSAKDYYQASPEAKEPLKINFD